MLVGASSGLELVFQKIVITNFARIELKPLKSFVTAEHEEDAAESLAVNLVL